MFPEFVFYICATLILYANFKIWNLIHFLIFFLGGGSLATNTFLIQSPLANLTGRRYVSENKFKVPKIFRNTAFPRKFHNPAHKSFIFYQFCNTSMPRPPFFTFWGVLHPPPGGTDLIKPF